VSQDRSDDAAPETGDDAATGSGATPTGGSSAVPTGDDAVVGEATTGGAEAASAKDEAEKVGSAAGGSEKGAAAPTRRARRGRDDAPAMPTGKAGRGNTAVAERVRTDADQPEDTRDRRANPVQYLKQVVEELRKVIWPTRGQMVTYTIVVFLFLVFMTALVSGVDFGAGKLVEFVFDGK